MRCSAGEASRSAAAAPARAGCQSGGHRSAPFGADARARAHTNALPLLSGERASERASDRRKVTEAHASERARALNTPAGAAD